MNVQRALLMSVCMLGALGSGLALSQCPPPAACLPRGCKMITDLGGRDTFGNLFCLNFTQAGGCGRIVFTPGGGGAWQVFSHGSPVTCQQAQDANTCLCLCDFSQDPQEVNGGILIGTSTAWHCWFCTK